MGKSKKKDKSDIRNPIAVAMRERYGNTTSVMRDRRERRAKDKKNSWQSEEH